MTRVHLFARHVSEETSHLDERACNNTLRAYGPCMSTYLKGATATDGRFNFPSRHLDRTRVLCRDQDADPIPRPQTSRGSSDGHQGPTSSQINLNTSYIYDVIYPAMSLSQPIKIAAPLTEDEASSDPLRLSVPEACGGGKNRAALLQTEVPLPFLPPQPPREHPVAVTGFSSSSSSRRISSCIRSRAGFYPAFQPQQVRTGRLSGRERRISTSSFSSGRSGGPCQGRCFQSPSPPFPSRPMLGSIARCCCLRI